MGPELTPEQRRAEELQTWEELSRRVNRAAARSGETPVVASGASLTGFQIPAKDPDGVLEWIGAKRATAMTRWNRLVATYPCRHYVEAEAPFNVMFTDAGAAVQQRLDEQVDRIEDWLKANLKEGIDFELEGTGVSSDFHIFFKTPEIYKRFCEATGETPSREG